MIMIMKTTRIIFPVTELTRIKRLRKRERRSKREMIINEKKINQNG